ncbi:MAG: PKD domain-containing protein [Chitinophagales bacterium]
MKVLAGLLLLLLFFPFSSRAWHIIGGELYYTCLGNNNYEITLKIYRDCNSTTPFDDPAAVAIYSSTGLLQQTLLIPFPGSNSIDPDLTNPCLQLPPGVCVEEAVYKTVLNLLPNSGGYDLSYQRCCRNNTIVNLYDPSNTGATFTSHIPGTTVASCNSSPRFKNYPPIVICVDQVLEFDHSATDPNGDSLVYSLCTPYQGADAALPQPVPAPPPPYDPVVWQPPYNVNNQIGGIPAMSIDPVTGLLTGFPTALGQYVVGVCVKEYRNGVFLCQDVRDFQFNITTCNALIEANFNVAGSTSVNDTLLLCGTYLADFSNLSYGTTTFNWDFGVPGITSDVSTLSDPVYVYPDTGVYKVVLQASLGQVCGDSVFKYVEIRKGITADFSFEDECMLTPVLFDDLSVPLDGYVSDWLWDFGDGTTNVQQDPAHAFTSSGTFNVSLTAYNNYGCKSILTKQVQVFPLPIVNAGPDTFICNIDTVTLHAEDGNSYVWSPNSNINDLTSPNPKVNPQVTTVYTVTVTNNFGCVSKDSVTIQTTDTVIATTSADITICEGESVQLLSSNAVEYLWSPDYEINSTGIANPVVDPDITTTYFVTASIGSCVDEDTVTVTVLFPPDVDAGEDVTINQGESVQLNATGVGTYKWSPPDNLDDPTIANPIADPINTITYTVIVSSENGCNATDSVTVIVTHNHLFLVPNAFTPNGDGLNDYFVFYTKGIQEVLSVKVFSRWGQEVYSDASGNDEGWDGSYKDLPCELGTYIYSISGITYDGDILHDKGSLTLIR